jgi:hypothetical protein
MAPPDKKRNSEAPVESDDAGASDTERGLVSPVERSDAYGPVVDRDMDRATGAGETPEGDARTTDAEPRDSRR